MLSKPEGRMRRVPKKILLLLLLLLATTFVGSVFGQSRWLSVESNRPDAGVYADSVWLGQAMQGVYSLPEGARRIVVVPPSVDNWLIPSITADLPAGAGDTVRVQAEFPYYYRLESIPSGATVFLESDDSRTPIGRTPLDYESEQALSGRLAFDLEGYLIRRVEPGSELWNRHLVMLETPSLASSTAADLSVRSVRSHNWIDYAAAGLAVAGGILAVHYKTKADNRYDRYNETRDPALKSDVKRLDTYSGVALGAMQAGIGVLAIRLIF
jgi:hypothetical protein